jgi:short-subunit dehydrogenase
MEHAVVITGASSGIGRVIARQLAAKGMNLVLAARSLEGLKTVAEECHALSVEVITQQVDVTDAEDVQRLAAAAQTAFGGIDVWINNAGITEVGRFMDIDRDEFRRVVDTNLFGVVNGSRAALRTFLDQGRGTLINISSILGAVPAPYESSYIASKFAVRGFTAALRQEMYAEGHRGIHICTVLPATMNTPTYRNAANKSGRVAVSIPPVYPAELVAEAVERLIRDPRPEIIVGGAGVVLAGLYRAMPAVVEKLFALFVRRFHFRDQRTANTKGNLLLPSRYTQEYGGQVTVPKYVDTIVAGGLTLALGVLLYKVHRKKVRS